MAQHRGNGGRFPRLRRTAALAFILSGRGANFLSSPQGGFVASLLSSRRFRGREDEALEQVAEINQQGQDIVSGDLGVGGPNVRILDTIDAFPGQRANLERRIAAGEPLGELERFTERIPSATEFSRDIAREGITRGDKLFDPESAVDRFNRTFAPVREGFEALPSQVAAGNQGVQDFYSGLRTEFGADAADLNRRFGESLTTARELVSGLGGQERRDINRAFDETASEAQARLSARGFGGTVQTSVASGIGRERTDALGRLQDRLTTQQLGVEETFGLGGLSARERLLGAGINLGAAQAGALQFGNQLFAGTAAGALANRGNIAGGQVGAFDQAAVNQQNNLLSFGGFQTDAQLRAAQLGLQFTGPFTVPFPSPNIGPTIYPTFAP